MVGQLVVDEVGLSGQRLGEKPAGRSVEALVVWLGKGIAPEWWAGRGDHELVRSLATEVGRLTRKLRDVVGPAGDRPRRFELGTPSQHEVCQSPVWLVDGSVGQCGLPLVATLPRGGGRGSVPACSGGHSRLITWQALASGRAA